MKQAGWIVALGVLLVTSIAGLRNATNELASAVTPLQLSVGYGQLLYGFLGGLGAVGLARRRPWCVTIIAAWGVAAAYVASVASFVFHDPTFSEEGTAAGVIAAGVSVLAISSLVVWAARVATRTPAPPAA